MNSTTARGLTMRNVIACKLLAVLFSIEEPIVRAQSEAAPLQARSTSSPSNQRPEPGFGSQGAAKSKDGEDSTKDEDDEEEMVTDRPDFTESVETVPPQRVQVETGVTFSRTKTERSQSYGEALLRIGLMKKLEARIGVPTYSIVKSNAGKDTGFEDLTLGFKLRLREGNEDAFELFDPTMSIIMDTSLPTGSSVYREPHLQPGSKLCFAWPLTEKLGLSSNVNYAYASASGKQFHQLSGSVSLGYELTERAGLYAETFGFSKEESGGKAVQYVNCGATYKLTKNHQLDARVGTAVTSEKPNAFFGVGYSFRF